LLKEKIRNLLGNTHSAKLNKIKKLVESITQATYARSNFNSKQLANCLNKIEAESNRLRAQASEYSDYSLKTETWAQGATLASYAERLATYLANTDLIAEEEKATKLWAQTALSTCSGDHHIVGPAMIASAALNKRTGNHQQANLIYAAVLEDFQGLLEEVEASDAALDENDVAALQTLRDAATELVDLEDVTDEDALAARTINRVDTALTTKTNVQHLHH